MVANPQSEIRNARNVRIYYFKAEAGSSGANSRNTPLRIVISQNVAVHAFSGNITLENDRGVVELVDSSDLTLTNLKSFHTGRFYTLSEKRGDRCSTCLPISVSGPQCRELLLRDRLARPEGTTVTFPYTQELLNDSNVTLADTASARESLQTPEAVGGVSILHYKDTVAIISEASPARATGSIRLHLRHNDRVAFFTRGDTRRMRVEVQGVAGFLQALPPGHRARGTALR
jgi:hypothetical protein